MNDNLIDYTQTIPDRFNPFNNDTENIQYRDDYRRVVPQISVSGCKLPTKPSKFEKKNIRKVYNRTAITLIVHLILVNVISTVLSFIVSLCVASKLGSIALIQDFFSSTSIEMGVVAITYTICNIVTFLFGCKVLSIPIAKVFNQPNVKSSSMVKHICMAWCLQGICMVAVSIISTVFAYLGINLIPDNALTEANYSSVTYCIVTFMYSCIVAPITEEMIFRGVVLRGFSVVSQRFGIFMSALLFGLLHGNVLQFITTFTVGMYLAYVATKYNSILPTIVIHFFINLVPTLTEMLLYNQGEEVENLVLLGFYGIMIVVGIVYMCLGFRKKSNRLPVQNASQRSRTTPVAFSSLGVLTIVTLYLITMVLTHVASL